MCNISSCDEVDFSKKFELFELLELKGSTLTYSQSVYNEIEASHIIIATPAQAAALVELDRMWQNCMIHAATWTR